MLSRRKFLKYSLGGLAGISLARCLPSPQTNNVKVKFRADNSGRAHQLKNTTKEFKVSGTEYKDIVIIGGGISGLSAGLHLKNKQQHNFVIYELADAVGGNSAWGKNEISEYPYGAHYLTLPNPNNRPLMDFLFSQGIIKGYDKDNKPIYNETDLCFDPEERLFIRGVFQDGLIPHYGLNAQEEEEISRFLKLVNEYKQKKGEDGKYFFDIPCSFASEDTALNFLDEITFETFLKQQHFNSPHLVWYLNYCCRDDYGGGISKVSAWAGINYFAAHRALAANTDSSRILTWPEGNGHLVKLFEQPLKPHIQTSSMVESVTITADGLSMMVKNMRNNTITQVNCKQCIVAVPPFVALRLLSAVPKYPAALVTEFQHAPWIVAAVILRNPEPGIQSPMCWDNVVYQSQSLGYIYNQHQCVGQLQNKISLSVYLPLDELEPKAARKEARSRDELFWKTKILNYLEEMHKGISENVEEIEICLWGHGMILPKPGLTKGAARKALSEDIESKLFFAHTDLSAYSVFEEGFDQGIRAAEKILKLNS